MQEITLPYHLLLACLIAIIALSIIVFYRKKLFASGKWKWFWISVTVFWVSYLLLVGGAIYVGIDARWTLNEFDLNKDGFFSGDEITAEQEKALNHVSCDAARNLSFITGLIFSAILALLVFVGGKIVQKMKKLFP